MSVQALRFYLHVRQGRELSARSRRFERHITGGVPRILILGDSTAVGTGVSDPEKSIAGRFAADFPNADVWNAAANGKRVGELEKDFPDVPAESFDLVLLQIGANDILRGTPIERFTASLRAVFAQANAAGTHVVALHSGNIGLAPIFPWPVSSILSARTATYREVYMRVAEEHGVAYVDLFTDAAHDPLAGPGHYASDDLHLTGKGYGHWYTQIRETMDDRQIVLPGASDHAE